MKLKDPEKVKKGPHDIRGFLKSTATNTAGYIMDEERIREEERYDGFYLSLKHIFEKFLNGEDVEDSIHEKMFENEYFEFLTSKICYESHCVEIRCV